MPAPFAAFAACQPGLEPLLVGELQALGAAPRALRGGVAFAADQAMVLRAGLWLGTASHVLLRLASFPCRALGELERKAKDVPWRDWLRPNVPVTVAATTKASRIYHTGAAIERVQNAIAAVFGRALPEPAATDAVYATVHVRMRDDVCTISIDATCDPLHRRGWRLDGRKAPLREDLAHALLLASGFGPGDALLDPFCGSGTIAIDAAAIARGLAPGRLRAPALQHLALFDADTWREVQRERRPAACTPGPIAGGDRDAGAIAACAGNAERAGLRDSIAWHEGAISTHPWLADPTTAPACGVLVTNPPYGVRVAKDGSLLPLYQTLGHRAARLGSGWRVAILAHDVRLARRTGLPLEVAFTTRHGGLSVTALVGPVATTATKPPSPDPTTAPAAPS
jgi:putative N6-adenine-specific DNA methylase